MAQEKMTLEDWLDDLCVRFIINLPREDLSSVARICFQIEEAQWFYEDFIRPLDPNLPSMSLKSFSLKMFQHCPLLASFSADSHIKAFEEFMQYKTRVPVRGAVMLNDAMDAAVLVRGYKKGASWSFPRGKINKDENDLDCAVREVYEETGYDLRAAGLIERNTPVHPLEVTMHDQQVRLYVFRGVPDDTIFETRTRKEIGAIKWYNVSDLPAYRKKKGVGRNGAAATSQDKFYMVAPFMVQLRQWVLKQKRQDAQNAAAYSGHNHPPVFYDENLTDDNVMPETLHAPRAAGTPSESLDNTTRELHRLLESKPPTQGLQLPSLTSNQQAGQSLMSILQPKMASNGQAPHTPLDREVVEAPEPATPQHHHPTQRIPFPHHDAPPSFPIEPNANLGYHQQYQQQYQQYQQQQQQYQQHRPRPQVLVNNEVNHPPAFLNQPRQFPNPPVQLLHPQPLPPQVQKAMLLRGMASSPMNTGQAPRVGPTGASQGLRQSVQSSPQTQQSSYGTQRIHHETNLPAELPVHSANLLNVLRGNNSQISNNNHQAGQQQSPRNMNASAENLHQQRPRPTSSSGFAGQYGPSALSTGLATMTTNHAQTTPSISGMQAARPTDKHRVGLLDMFTKKAESTVSRNQVDGQGSSMPSPQSGKREQPVQPEGHQASPTADARRGFVDDDKQPIRMNPETNLPFGAVTILARPQPGQVSVSSPTMPARNSNEFESDRNLPLRPHPSPGSSYPNMSPKQPQFKVQKPQRMGQSSPLAQPPTTQSYPYGSAQGSAPNPLSKLPSPPVAAKLSMAAMMKPRQPPTAEQKDRLLSHFMKPSPTMEQGKGKEAMMGDAPRPRLGSFASSAGEGMSGAAAASRRGSGTPLSPADRNFLLGFLENASHNTKC